MQHGLCETAVMVRSRLLLSVDGDIESFRFSQFPENDRTGAVNTSRQHEGGDQLQPRGGVQFHLSPQLQSQPGIHREAGATARQQVLG